MAEQRYQAVMTVIGGGLAVTQAAEEVGVSRQTMHAWLAQDEAEGLEGLKRCASWPSAASRRRRRPQVHIGRCCGPK